MKAEIKIPAVGESITEATIAEWTKSNGDYVQRDEILLVLETDKASVEVVAEQAGVLSIKVEEGETVEIGTVVGEIDTDAQAPAGAPEKPATPPPGAPAAQAAAPETPPPLTPPPGAPGGPSSPSARKAAADRGVNIAQVQGSGKDGRINKQDVLNAPTQAPAAAPASPAPQQAKAPAPELPQAGLQAPSQESRRVPMSKLRQTIAKRLVQAQQDAAILTTFNEIDMSAVMELRKKYKDSFKEKHGIGLGFMGFFVKAAIEALKEYPLVNAMIDGNELIMNDFINVGIAVGTEKGLMVPVIKNTDYLSIADIEKSIRYYAIKARDGKIGLDDLAGGTFTISNGGVYGSLMSTPILNPPQSGILGLHKIEDRPVAINGEVKIRPMMYVALSYDHRIVDGKESVSFLVKIKECMEDPARMLLDI